MDGDLLEPLLEFLDVSVEQVSLEHFRDEFAVVFKNTVADIDSVHAQFDRSRMVHRIGTGDVGRHVGKDDVHFSSDHVEKFDHGRVVGDVPDDE